MHICITFGSDTSSQLIAQSVGHSPYDLLSANGQADHSKHGFKCPMGQPLCIFRHLTVMVLPLIYNNRRVCTV